MMLLLGIPPSVCKYDGRRVILRCFPKRGVHRTRINCDDGREKKSLMAENIYIYKREKMTRAADSSTYKEVLS